MNVKLLIFFISFTVASQTQEQLALARTKLDQGLKNAEKKVRLNEDQCEIASFVLSDMLPGNKADILRDALADNVKEFGYKEAKKNFVTYVKNGRANLSNEYNAFFDAFLKYYEARFNLSMAMNAPHNDHLEIDKLKKDINRPAMAFLNKKEAYAAALVQNALKNSSSPKPRSMAN